MQSRCLNLSIFLVLQMLTMDGVLGADGIAKVDLPQRKQELENAIVAYEKSKDITPVTEVWADLKRSMMGMSEDTNSTLESKQMRADLMFSMRVKILEACYKARDWDYDLENPPAFGSKVFPRMGVGEPSLAGMDPDSIVNPEIRRKYQEEVAENNRRKFKFQHEKQLQRIIDENLYVISSGIKCLPEGSSARQRMLETITNVVKHIELKRRLLLEASGKSGAK